MRYIFVESVNDEKAERRILLEMERSKLLEKLGMEKGIGETDRRRGGKTEGEFSFGGGFVGFVFAKIIGINEALRASSHPLGLSC